ncbi:hypothetical protein GCM10027181_04500 [Rheinheimera gaetbuli]
MGDAPQSLFRSSATKSSVRNRLRDIKHVLTYGGCPSQILEKKDAQWAGE